MLNFHGPMKDRSDLENMKRVWYAEQIKDLMSRRAMYSANEERAKELDELWVKEPIHMASASFGRNYGYYVGMDAIRAYYLYSHEKKVKSYNGKGYCEVHPVGTPYVLLAEDGMSARGLWYSIGQETYPDMNGKPIPYWTNDRLAADFVLEKDGWKIWRLLISNDVWAIAGRPISEVPVRIPEEKDWIKKEFGTPTVPMKVHDPLYLWSDGYPDIPEFYDTLDASNSFGPEGHPNYRKEWIK